MLQKFDLSGKTALITGGAGLLGRQHALALLEIGARVIICDINQTGLSHLRGSDVAFTDPDKVHFLAMDVTDKHSILQVQRACQEKGCEPDILVNNAAIDPKVTSQPGKGNSSRLENFSLQSWEQEIAVGLTGAFLCAQIFGTRMAETGRGGVILNIASDLSVIAPDQRIYQVAGRPDSEQPVKPVTYSVIKAGLVGLTKYLSTYWPDRGVRANSLSPGGVFNGQREDFLSEVMQLIPLGRMAGIDEYHSAIQFLCSDASSYMNGHNLVIDGGRSVW